MRHLEIADHFGRGKFYDLLFVRKDLRDELKHQLERHAVVGKTVETSPYLPQLYSCVRVPTGVGWWVIDRWIEGSSLDASLSAGPLPRNALPRLMKDILNGLAVLHSHSIVLRELNPACVLIPTNKRPAMITDVEMAKLLNGGPTVRNGIWPPSPFRAPEVESNQVTPAADLFSWAVVLLNAATGHVPDSKRISGLVTEAALPDAVSEVVRKCLKSAPTNRPQDCRTVQKAIAKWA
jgi:serine/threonine protein kinase